MSKAYIIEYDRKGVSGKDRRVALTTQSAVEIIKASMNDVERYIFWNKATEKKLFNYLDNAVVCSSKRCTLFDLDIYKVAVVDDTYSWPKEK